MAHENNEAKVILTHHEAQTLCTTRLPYRQGRKLTAVKVYTVNSESNHLLIFGVPSLNLRQETKALFMKFGKLQQFSITTKYPAETFTENYHAIFEDIQSARIAKKMLDTKNFYGGSLHICYAPELESIEETKFKLCKRQKDVLNRLRNLNKAELQEPKKLTEKFVPFEIQERLPQKKMNMGDINILQYNNDNKSFKNKRKIHQENIVIEKKFKPCFAEPSTSKDNSAINVKINSENSTEDQLKNKEIKIIDFTSTEIETLSNIDEGLNYKNFGNEVIKKIPTKPVNKIKFNIGNKR